MVLLLIKCKMTSQGVKNVKARELKIAWGLIDCSRAFQAGVIF